MIRFVMVSFALLVLSSCAMPPQVPPAARSELAPTGKLRVGINYQNFLLVNKNPAGGESSGIAEVDREGVRIAVSAKSAYDLYLTRNLQRAKLLRAPTIDASYELFVRDKLDALAGLKPRLATDAEKLPGSRVLQGRFSAVQQSIGTPQGRPSGAKYLREYSEDVKASGFVAKAIEKHAVRGVSVAAAAPQR